MKKQTKSKRLNFLRNNLFMLKIVWQIKPSRIVFTVLINLMNGSLNFISQIFMLRYIVNAATNKIPFQDVIFVSSVVVLYQCLAMFINSYYNAIFCPTCDNEIKQCFQRNLFEKALTIDIIEYDNPDFYDKFTRALSESNKRALQVVDLMGRFINSLFVLVTVSLVIFIAEPLLIFIAILPFVINIILRIKVNKNRYNQNYEETKPNRIRNYVRRIFFMDGYAKEIRLTNISKVLKRNFNFAIEQNINITKKYSRKNIKFGLIMPLANQVIVYLGTIIYTSYKTIIKQTLEVADAFVIIRSIWQVSTSLSEFSNVMTQLHNNSLYVDNLNVFMEYTPKIKNKLNTLHKENFLDNIKITSLSFKYFEKDDYVLQNINLTINKGEKIAIVGHNGSGKSTLIKLLLRLYEPTIGRIEMDGINNDDYDIAEYRRLFSVVFQDYKNFSVSILDNILCGDPQNKENIENALHFCGLDNKVNNLKFGLYSYLTKEFDNEGEVFSVGELQKLCLARAFVRNSPILIMDEASSSLDPIAEYELFNSIINLSKEKTVIYISHRLSSVVLADRIVMLENGRIVEEGTHGELLHRKGKYAEFFMKQAESYVEESK